jgi:LysM repeat protein
MDGTFEGLTPEQSEGLRGAVQDNIYALREKLTAELSGASPYEGDVSTSGRSAKDILADRNSSIGAKTVVTDASGKTSVVSLPPPSSEANINRGPIARYVNTKRGMVRVEVNQEFPSDMIASEEPAINLDALKGYVKSGSAPAPAPAPAPTPAPTPAPAPAPEKLPPPPSKEPASSPAPVVAPAKKGDGSADPELSDRSKSVKPISRSLDLLKRIFSNYSADLEKGKKPDGTTYIDAKSYDLSSFQKYVSESTGMGLEQVRAATSADGKIYFNIAEVDKIVGAQEKQYDVSTTAYARALGITPKEFFDASKDAKMSPHEYYKEIQKSAVENGMSAGDWFKAINTPAEEETATAKIPEPPSAQKTEPTAPANIPAPPSATESAPEKAPEGLPEPEVKPQRILTGREAVEAKAKKLIELGASPSSDGTVRYWVQKGDTLGRVAKRFGMSTKALEDLLAEEGKNWNYIQPNTSIPLLKAYTEAPISEAEATGEDPSSTDATDDSGSADKITFTKEGKVVKPASGDAVKKAESEFVQLAHGRALTLAEREIEATKKSITGLTRYMEKLASREAYYGAEANYYGGFTNDEDFYVPEFDQEFPDIDDTLGGTTNTKGGAFVTSNSLKETEAFKQS